MTCATRPVRAVPVDGFAVCDKTLTMVRQRAILITAHNLQEDELHMIRDGDIDFATRPSLTGSSCKSNVSARKHVVESKEPGVNKRTAEVDLLLIRGEDRCEVRI